MLTTLPYHLKVKDYFKAQPKTWDYFSKNKTKENQLLEFKTELLKNTYKFDSQSDSNLYDKVNLAKEKLFLQNLPVTVYQAQYTDELNASIIYLEGEAHIVFSGAVMRLLNEEELLAVIAHELTHIKLYSMLEGELEVADRIITSIANNYNSEPSYYETARLFRLYTEIFCDRGAFTVLGTVHPVISSLVKISTGLDKVNPESYLKQADEIFASDKEAKTAGISHPENFIRAKAIKLWETDKENCEKEILKMIEGTSNLDQLDIFNQGDLSNKTKKSLQLFLKPKWFQTTLTISHARQYFNDFAIDEKSTLDNEFVESLSAMHTSLKEYFCYLLLDFVLIDPALESVPAGWALQFTEDLGIKAEYESILKKEMKFSEKKLQQYKQKALESYYDIKENENEQIYE